MNKIKIDHLKQSRTAVLTADLFDKGWLQILRVCQDATSETKQKNQKTIELPWWIFLSIREAIAYYIEKYNLGVIFTVEAERFLIAANEHQEFFSRPKEPVTIEILQEKLFELGFKRTLKSFQIRNVSKLSGLPAGATFSVPGAGKTTEALAYYTLTKGSDSKLLIICPVNAFSVWEEEVEACFEGTFPVPVRLRGGREKITEILNKNPKISTISYQQVFNVVDILAAFLLANEVSIFLDESHKIKSLFGSISNSVRSLSYLAKNKLIMSGTPLPNSMIDIIPQFNFLYPEEEKVTELNVKEKISKVFVRTTKKELGLPPPQRKIILVQMNPYQRKLYDLMCSEMARIVETGLSRQDKYALRALGRSALKLLQLVSNPSLLAETTFSHEELLKNVLIEGDSPKLELATQMARVNAKNGLKTVIWSSFVKNVELLSFRLADLNSQFIHGGVKAGSEEEEDTREAILKRFHDDPNSWVLVGNPAACGEGISLHTVCHNAIYLDRNYNAAQYLQSEDRIHRIGLPKNQITSIEILCCENSIDERVNNRLIKKAERMGRVLEDPDLNIEPLPYDLDDEGMDFDDLKDLLKHVVGVGKGK